MRINPLVVLTAMSLLPACLIVVGDDVASTETGGGTGETGDGDGDSPGDGDGDSGDGDGDSAGDGDGDSPGDGDGDPAGDGDGDSPGDGDGDPGDCAGPQPELNFSYQFSGLEQEFVISDLDWDCTVTDQANGTGVHLEFDCPEAEGPVLIDIDAMPLIPSLPVQIGSSVSLRYIYDGPFWFNVHLRLDSDEFGHLLTLVDSDSLLPGQQHVFELPQPTTSVANQCTWTDDFCGMSERLGLAFDFDGDSFEVLDGHHELVGPPPGTDVWVHEATHLHEIVCTDTPDEWFRLLVVNGS